MKLMWFHLMPYTELPDDFREKHPSVWVDIHSSLFDPRRAHHMYNDFMDELEFAAECGFDAICVNEHHSNGYGLMPSPNLIASSLARRTSEAALCVLGSSLALHNPPTRAAGLRDRGNPTPRHPEPGGSGGADLALRVEVSDVGARDGCDRRQGLCDHRLARRSRRATARGRNRPECRAPDAAIAVRQHEQGFGAIQHTPVRG